jgi:hypothetical protein
MACARGTGKRPSVLYVETCRVDGYRPAESALLTSSEDRHEHSRGTVLAHVHRASAVLPGAWLSLEEIIYELLDCGGVCSFMGLYCRPACLAIIWNSDAHLMERALECASAIETRAIHILVRCFDVRNVWFRLFRYRSLSGMGNLVGTLECRTGSRAPQLRPPNAAHVRDLGMGRGADWLANGKNPKRRPLPLSEVHYCRNSPLIFTARVGFQV